MKITKDNVFYSFCSRNEQAVRVDAPATLDFETMDCFGNQLRNPEDIMEEINWDRINPATGPVYVNGAEPGDALKVTINSIELNEKGTVCCLNEEGILGARIEGSHTRVASVSDGKVHYEAANGLKVDIPVKPMIGVIGVAPEGELNINTGTPGKHGGNMDTTMIGVGATLYLPVAVEGALFGLGDLHAVMGDGEIGVSGFEIPADVNVTLDICKGRAQEYPVLETEDYLAVIVSKETVDEACQRATELMQEIIAERTDLDMPDIVMLMSLLGNLQICQIVDPEKTVRFVFPKKYIPGLMF
ncbi:MAG: acetamidase/formamidase family protein [Eubacteriales bacterium]|nr:acetamidase/formamidase family protein [Eubacteriales bacterium]